MKPTTASGNIPYTELKKKILSSELPETLQLSKAVLIFDVNKFLDSHFKAIEANKGRKVVMPIYERLLKFYKIISNNR